MKQILDYAQGLTLLDDIRQAFLAGPVNHIEGLRKAQTIIYARTKGIDKNSLTLRDLFDRYTYLSQVHVAARANINNTLLSQYISGTKKPSDAQVDKIARAIKEIAKELTELKLT